MTRRASASDRVERLAKCLKRVWLFLVLCGVLQVRVVKSAKDRSFEAIRTAVGQIRTKIKINDWNGIQTNFDECNKHVEKSKVRVEEGEG